MRLFIDTSTLFKKYVEEAGSKDFEELLMGSSEIAVAPTAWLEVNSILERRFREKTSTRQMVEWLRLEIKKDFDFFFKVTWNENIENKAMELIRRHGLKTMDGIQLASAVLSEAGGFVTSDRPLYLAAKKRFPVVCFI